MAYNDSIWPSHAKPNGKRSLPFLLGQIIGMPFAVVTRPLDRRLAKFLRRFL
jgi:hypothetical protein